MCRHDAHSAALTAALLTLVAMTAACASSGGVPRPFPGASIPAPRETAPRADRVALLETALGLRGVPYRNGGSDPAGFDCSGFTQWVFAAHGLALPREVRDQFRIGSTINTSYVRAGDLLFFSTTGPGATHVAIALGDGAFVHAPGSNGVVRVERLLAPYWATRFVGARRIL